MDISTRSRLEGILTAHESEIEREQDRIDQEQMAEILFAQQFAALKMNTIVPAFADLESELKRHGHVCKIVEIDALDSGDLADVAVSFSDLSQFYHSMRSIPSKATSLPSASVTAPAASSLNTMKSTPDCSTVPWVRL